MPEYWNLLECEYDLFRTLSSFSLSLDEFVFALCCIEMLRIFYFRPIRVSNDLFAISIRLLRRFFIFLCYNCSVETTKKVGEESRLYVHCAFDKEIVAANLWKRYAILEGRGQFTDTRRW